MCTLKDVQHNYALVKWKFKMTVTYNYTPAGMPTFKKDNMSTE